MNQRLLNAAAIVFMVCSLTATTVLVWTRLAARQVPQALPSPSAAARYVAEWRAVASVGHVRGVATAPITLVEFADYQCPACRAFEVTLAELLRRNRQDVRVLFRHFPLKDIHPLAVAAANGAECAAEQAHFEEWHHTVYTAQDSLGILDWPVLAKRAGVPDSAKFAECFKETKYQAIIDRDAAAGDTLQIHATPTFLLDDSLFVGTRTLEELQRMIAARNAHAAHD
jgi:protein-disulfide isomerase